MIKGVGVDLVKIDRLDKLSDYQLKRMFAPSEVSFAMTLSGKRRSEFLSSRFAAKEAFSKALRTGLVGFSLTDIAVLTDNNGAPFFEFSPSLRDKIGNKTFHLSLSHEDNMAIAMVVCDEI